MKPFLWLFRWINIAFIFMILLSYIAPYYHPKSAGYLYYAGLFYAFLLWINIAFVVFWLWLRQRFALFSLIAIILGWSHLESTIGYHFFSTPNKNSLSIMTFNIGGLPSTFAQAENRAKGFLEASAFFTEQQPDILCMQETFECRYIFKEVDNQANTKIKSLESLPYAAFSSSKEVAIMSRYPIVHYEDINIGTSYNTCCFADININGKILRVYTMHLRSNNITTRSEDFLKNKTSEDDDEKKLDKGKYILRSVRKMAFIRGGQSEIIKRHILQSPYPVVVCGDFNDTPQSYCYHTLADGLQDGFKEAGLGFGTTFAGSIPMLTIDHVLLNPNLKVDACRILDSGLSDHYAVMTHFRF